MKNKKKIIAGTALVAALAVGGTAAFFTSQDDITNIFKTGTTTDVEDPNAGIDVNENFTGLNPGPDGILGTNDDTNPETGEHYGPNGPDGTFGTDDDLPPIEYDDNEAGDGYGEVATGPEQVLPGVDYTKEVRITSTAQYPQYIRAAVSVVVLDKDANDVTTTYGKYINVTYNTTAGVWTLDNGKYYYNQILAPGASTEHIIEAVEVGKDAPNEMKNMTFKVIVDGEGLQATPEAWDAEWNPTTPTRPTTVDND